MWVLVPTDFVSASAAQRASGSPNRSLLPCGAVPRATDPAVLGPSPADDGEEDHGREAGIYMVRSGVNTFRGWSPGEKEVLGNYWGGT